MKEGLTFDDILLLPRKSSVLPTKVNVKTKLTKNIELNIPLISSAMDTVTEADLAIAIALEGGMGVIHKNLPVDIQVEEVMRVKRFENGFIHDPIALPPSLPIREADVIIRETGFSRIPVVHNGKLRGLLTQRDYSVKQHASLKVEDRMVDVKDLITAKKGISLEEAYNILLESRRGILLVVDKEDRLDSIVTRSDIEKNEEFPKACKDKDQKLRVGAAIGPSEIERAQALVKAGVDVLVLDTAHGHSVNVIEAVRTIKKKFKVDVIAGNVGTAEAAKALIAAGADAIKIGIGPGAICTTRIISGVGIPQITAILDCAKAAGNIPVIADGGIRYSGDIAKAIAAGASSIMIGSLFAGCEETPGRTVFIRGRKFKKYRGMGSLGAMSEGSKDRYFQKEIVEESKLVPEGIEGVVPYRGTLAENIYQLIGGLRSAMGYCGCKNIPEMRKNVEFIKITNASLKEGHPHDVTITEEAPNYHVEK